VRTEPALPTRANTPSHPTRVLLQAARPCRSTAPGANGVPSTPKCATPYRTRHGCSYILNRDAPRRSTAGSPDRPVRTEQAPTTRVSPHSHPTRVLLQAAAPCRSTAPGANAPLVLNLFLMLLIQQIHNPAGRRIPLHSRQQRLAHQLIIIITHRLAQRIQNGQ